MDALDRALFKARRVDSGEWVEGNVLTFEDDNQKIQCIICPVRFNFARAAYPRRDLEIGFWHQVDPATVCQYTGLTDKNGVKIFEGDILQACDYPKDSLTFPVVWYEKHAGFNLMGLNTIAFNIIGNIHDKENNNG